VDLLRRRKKAPVSLEGREDAESPSGEPGPDERAQTAELREAVLEAIRSLSEPMRLATTLYYIDGYSVEEVGEFLDVPPGTVKRRLHSSRRKLKERMLAMVEDELKSSRPGPEFRDTVLRSVSRVEVRPEKTLGEMGCVLLVDDVGRCLPIVIGKTEELAIDRALKKVDFSRPLTHELVVSTLKALDVSLTEVCVVDLRENTFYGELVLARGGEEIRVDCRPSDGIALAMLTGAKVTVAEHVIAQASWKMPDGTAIDAETFWEKVSICQITGDEARALADRALGTCAGIADLPDDQFKILLGDLGWAGILFAFHGAHLNPECNALREHVMDLMERFKPDFKRHFRPMPRSVEHVEKAQDAIKAALEKLEK